MGSSNETSAFGPAISPWRRAGDETQLVPGGSSGGSAAAVSARLCLAATATDTGGSIASRRRSRDRGHQADYGRCSRWGIVAFASSLDQAGPITRTVRDSAMMLQAMAGPDAKDTTCARSLRPRFRGCRGARGEGVEDRNSQGIPRARHAGGDRASLGAARPGCARRVRRSSRSRCRIRNMPCRPITSSRRRRRHRTSRAMTACATACGSRGKDILECMSCTRAAGFGRRGQAPHQ